MCWSKRRFLEEEKWQLLPVEGVDGHRSGTSPGVRGALGCPCGSGEVCALLPVRTYSSFPYAAEMHFLLRKSW